MHTIVTMRRSANDVRDIMMGWARWIGFGGESCDVRLATVVCAE
jgi:hypothetical protein